MRKQIVNACVYALLGALLIVVQVALAALPNVELVSLLIIVYACVLGVWALVPVAVFVCAEALIYGFGLWVINYFYAWPILVLIAILCRRNRSPVVWALISGAYGLFFGALCSVPQFFIGGAAYAFSYWINGIPFDIIHCVGNFAVAMLLFKPLYRALELAHRRMGKE